MRIVNTNDPESPLMAAEVLRAGGVIVYPTDTAYGLGADATNPAAVEKIFAIKGREPGKPLPAIVSSLEEAIKYGDFSPTAHSLARTFWPGGLTIEVPTTDSFIASVLRGERVVAFRVPAHDWCRDVARALGKPITSTSANASGKPAEYSLEGVQESFGASGEIVDLWVDGGALAGGPVSTVVSVEGEEIVVKREGAISGADLKKVLE